MNKQYDLIVVGAGPAGLMSAITAARGGLNVLVVEQKTDIAWIPRTCVSTLYTTDCNGELVTVDGDRWIFHKNDFSIKYTGQWKDCWKFYHISPSGYRIRIERDTVPAGKAFNKETLIEDLAKEAKKSGVRIQCGTRAVDIKNLKKGVVLTLNRRGKEEKLKARFAIGADGLNSIICEKLGLNKYRRSYGVMAVCSYVLEGVKPAYPDTIMCFVGKGKMKSRYIFYGWPRPARTKGDKNQWELLYTQFVGGNNLEAPLQAFMKDGNYASWFKKAKVVQKRGCVMSMRVALPYPRVENTILVGDAPCWTEVEVQSAIQYGYRAGKGVLDELKGDPGLDEYTDYWKNTYEYLEPGRTERANWGYVIYVLDDDDLDYLFKLMDNKILKGYYEWKVMDYVRQVLEAELPRIAKERPSLVPKIKNLLPPHQLSLRKFVSI